MELNLVRDESQFSRIRPANSSKIKDLELDITKTRKSKTEMVKGAMGQKWCFKNNNKPTPTIKEIIDGLREYHKAHLYESLIGCDEPTVEIIVQNYSSVFDKILEYSQIKDVDQPLVSKTERVKGGFRSLKQGLSEIMEPSTQLILWLYSIEPPFYFWVNQACRNVSQYE